MFKSSVNLYKASPFIIQIYSLKFINSPKFYSMNDGEN